ncbi:hypothetical protein VCRA2126O85_60178 [Vibrio crassostreae]|nr:hypothetical protein VCRA2125O83_60052 [Vibrio crassostreae]CAK3061266.1 hypothetical protein VCRA2126O84_60052 [Vibrio crassostreae]CAK3069904.1 hypothetical protein VCRA2126O86_60178 [Vibrio crassostreae]CAK3071941.1 hypothetical protein VCRA2126O85_60178 [Vibrio crassostreae]CAK3072082.1 hypothetical protein VCRA2128O106_60179 [Vibrio crassostreae]
MMLYTQSVDAIQDGLNNFAFYNVAKINGVPRRAILSPHFIRKL